MTDDASEMTAPNFAELIACMIGLDFSENPVSIRSQLRVVGLLGRLDVGGVFSSKTVWCYWCVCGCLLGGE
jgi:hypothetical protein